MMILLFCIPEEKHTHIFPNAKFGSIYPKHCNIIALDDHDIKSEVLSFI